MPLSITTGLPTLDIVHEQADTTLQLDPPVSHSTGQGTLYIAKSALVWYRPETQTCISIDYPSIVMHAIARSGDRYCPLPHIYCQLVSTHFEDEQGQVVQEETDVELPNEMRLIPQQPALDAMFAALSQCACLHPDEDVELEETEEELEAIRAAAVDHLESVFDKTYGQFEDAPENNVTEADETSEQAER